MNEAAVRLHVTRAELEAGLEDIRQSPRDEGVLALIVRRPQSGEREALSEGVLDLADGLVGDNWKSRGSFQTSDGSPHPDMQLSIMNARVIALVARDKDRWQLSGDQLFIDLDLSRANLPPGTRLAIGSAIVQVTEQVHASCKTFAARYGVEALNFVHSPIGKQLRLRGISARVVESGVIRVGEIVTKRDVSLLRMERAR